jgi:hypothetical protein
MIDLDACENYFKRDDVYHAPTKLCKSDHRPDFKVIWLDDQIVTHYAIKRRDPDFARGLVEGLAAFSTQLRNGKFEVFYGRTVTIPIRGVLNPAEVVENLPDGIEIRRETLAGTLIRDYYRYTDNLCYAALAYWNGCQKDEALAEFQKVLEMWDGKGFRDRFTECSGHHRALTLGLCLYTARTLGYTLDDTMRIQIDDMLEKLQDDDTGGIITLYEFDGMPIFLASTEPTAFTLIGYEGEHWRAPQESIGGGIGAKRWLLCDSMLTLR